MTSRVLQPSPECSLVMVQVLSDLLNMIVVIPPSEVSTSVANVSILSKVPSVSTSLACSHVFFLNHMNSFFTKPVFSASLH